MSEKPRFYQLLPILFVRDLEPEIAFYRALGFELSYQGDEFPGFVALKSGDIEFGLSVREGFDAGKARDSFVWQMDTDSLSKVIAVCDENGFRYSGPQQYWQEEDRWEMYIETPNGYTLQLEKQGRD